MVSVKLHTSKVCVECLIMHEFFMCHNYMELIKFEIGGSHNSVAENSGDLGCYAVLLHA
jgi:hypothetical protein